ncbi:MAG: thiolase domain-containing protein [Bacillota bacterium]
MRDVSVIGVGTTPFGVLEGQSIKEIAVTACNRAIEDAGIARNRIEAFILGNYVSGMLVGQETIGPLVANNLALSKDISALKVEGACCSSGVAFRLGYQMVAAGIHDVVLVAGVEKMTSESTEKNTAAISSALDVEEAQTGLTFPGFFALVARHYMEKYGVAMEQISQVSVKNRYHGTFNPRARFRKPVIYEEIDRGKMVADPLRLHDCCPIADGAAAAVICRSDWAKEFTKQPVTVIGSGQALGYSTIHDMDDPTTMLSTVKAAQQAYSMARISPGEIDVVELHDCFTIAEVIDCEDLGLLPRGEAARAIAMGQTRIDGIVPVNLSGGLLSKGHPVGATGLGQVYEIVRQLRGEHENQVKGAEVGLAHNLGGTGQIATVHILRKG